MHRKRYGFDESAFSSLPDLRFLYLGENHRRALKLLEHAVHDGSCFCLLAGQAGVGKTMLLHALIQHLDEHIRAGLINCRPDSAPCLVGLAAAAFKLDTANAGVDNIRQRLADYLADLHQSGILPLLIIDDAQNLDIDGFKTLIDLLGMDANLKIILAGRPELKQRFTRRVLGDFVPRAIVQCDLSPLSLSETDSYIRHRVAVAGGPTDLFLPSASEALYQYNQGIPQLINYTCDLVLKAGQDDDREKIDRATVMALFNDPLDSETQDLPPEPENISESPKAVDSKSTMPADEIPVTQASDSPDLLHSQAGATEQRPVSKIDERVVADLFRLSLDKQCLQTRWVVFGSLASVILLATAVLWLLSELQSAQLASPVETAQLSSSMQTVTEPPAKRCSAPDSPAPDTLPGITDAVSQVEQPAQTTADVPPIELREPVVGAGTLIQTITISSRVAPDADSPRVEQTQAVQPPPVEQAKPATIVSVPASSELPDEAEQLKKLKALAAKQRKMERNLAAQRAKRDRLRKEARREEERLSKARTLAEAAKKSSQAAWDQYNKSTPEPFPGLDLDPERAEREAKTRARAAWDQFNKSTPEAFPSNGR